MFTEILLVFFRCNVRLLLGSLNLFSWCSARSGECFSLFWRWSEPRVLHYHHLIFNNILQRFVLLVSVLNALLKFAYYFGMFLFKLFKFISVCHPRRRRETPLLILCKVFASLFKACSHSLQRDACFFRRSTWRLNNCSRWLHLQISTYPSNILAAGTTDRSELSRWWIYRRWVTVSLLLLKRTIVRTSILDFCWTTEKRFLPPSISPISQETVAFY